MPELPEVHTITTDLEKYLKGAKISKVVVKPEYKSKINTPLFEQELINKEIKEIYRIAKNIILELNDGKHIGIHLAMTGRLLIRTPKHVVDKWELVTFDLEKKGKNVELRFCDMRWFGKIFLTDIKGIKELKKKYGPEPLDKALDTEGFLKILHSKKTTVKNLLLDQAKIAGLGNVYATDALWISKIHPQRQTKTLTHAEAAELLKACREILEEGIKNRGLTIDSYVDALGKPGYQQNFFRVYNQKQCKTCKGKIEQIKQNGRTTHFCPKCQK